MDKPKFMLKPGQRWVFYGRSGSGKTYTAVQILSLIKRTRPKPYVILVSPTAATDVTWKAALKEWRAKRRKNIVDRHLTAYTPDVKEYLMRVIQREERKPIVLMMDDMGEDHTINRTWVDNPIREIAIKSRHVKITLLMLYQSVSETLKIIGTNADVIVSKKLGPAQRELFRKMYLEDYSAEEFRRVCDTAWRDKWDSLVVDRTDMQHVRIWRNFTQEIHIRQDTSGYFFHFYVILRSS